MEADGETLPDHKQLIRGECSEAFTSMTTALSIYFNKIEEKDFEKLRRVFLKFIEDEGIASPIVLPDNIPLECQSTTYLLARVLKIGLDFIKNGNNERYTLTIPNQYRKFIQPLNNVSHVGLILNLVASVMLSLQNSSVGNVQKIFNHITISADQLTETEASSTGMNGIVTTRFTISLRGKKKNIWQRI